MAPTDKSPSPGAQRRLAAVLIADIVKYSQLMGLDEEGTLARMKRHRREIIDPTIAEHHGRIVNAPGDSLLAVFDSPLEAVRCALVIQQSISARYTALPKSQWMQYRIGVNLGDIIVDPEDQSIYGDGVNIAARLQASAEPGGVNISGGVYEQIKNKLVCGYQSMGDEKLKNITDPVRIYRVLPDLAAVSRARRVSKRMVLAAAAGSILIGLLGWYTWRELNRGGWIEQASPASRPPARQEVVVTLPSWATDAAFPKLDGPNAQMRFDILPAKPERTLSPAPLDAASAPPPEQRRPPEPSPERQAATTPSAAAPAPPPAAADTAMPEPAKPQTQTALLAPSSTLRLPNAGPHPVNRDCPTCPEMIALPGGSFGMGSNEDPSEKPVHGVTVKPFAIGRFPVTVAEWRECFAARVCTLNPAGPDDAPVRNLSWTDARDYANWLSKATGKSYRLPTEAEWEYATRGATDSRFWWGDKVTAAMANCKDCGGAFDQSAPQKVGNFAANPYGLYDTAGIVKEWVSDCWHRNYQGAPRDGSSWEEPKCTQRVLRGGSWRGASDEIRPSSRAVYDAGVRYPTHGLRIAKSLN